MTNKLTNKGIARKQIHSKERSKVIAGKQIKAQRGNKETHSEETNKDMANKYTTSLHRPEKSRKNAYEEKQTRT